MKIQFYMLFLAACLMSNGLLAQDDLRKQAPQPGPAPKIEIGDYHTFKLDNGLQGIVVENHKIPRVSFQLFVDLPLIAEGEKAGAADLAGQLLSTGTTTRQKAEIDEAVDFIGASLNSSASGVSGSSLTKHREKLMEVLAEVALNPSFPEAEFDKLKKQTLSNLAQAKTDPNTIAGMVARVLRYGAGHPYGELTTEETIENITLEDVKNFYDTYFTPSRTYFVVVGDISEKEAKTLAEKHFSSWKGKPVMEKDYPVPAKPEATQVNFVDKAGAVQSVVNITYPIVLKQGDPKTIPVSLMNTILGGGFSSRLNLNLREDKAYTYGARSQVVPDEHVGYFNASASVRNEVTDSALVEFMSEIRRIRTEKVSEAELKKAKSILAGSFARSLEQPMTVARFALNTVRYDLPKDYYATYLKKLEKVTAEDIMQVAKAYVHPESAHIIIVGNKGEVADKLSVFAADKKVNFYDTYGNPIEQKEMDVPQDMTAQSVIDNYIAAIGGAEKLAQVKDMTVKMSASVQGQNMMNTIYKKAPNKMAMMVNMNGMAVVTQKFDGTDAQVMQMGQAAPLDDAAKAELKAQSYLFPETQLTELGYQMELMGIEQVEGKQAYAVKMTSPSGNTSTDYYDINTGLKIRSVAAGNGNSVISDFSDYREVDGIKFPYKTEISGMMPFPLAMNVESVEINTGVEDSVFEIE